MTGLPPHLGAHLDGLDAQVRHLAEHVDQLRTRLDHHDARTAHDQVGEAAGAGEPVFATGTEWATGFLLPTFVRPVGGAIRWCQHWADHDEALLRIEAMWRAWEALRLNPGTGMSVYLLHHLDPGLAALTATTGPFARCTPDRHIPNGRDEPRRTPPASEPEVRPRRRGPMRTRLAVPASDPHATVTGTARPPEGRRSSVASGRAGAGSSPPVGRMAAVTVDGDAAVVVPEGYPELLEQLKARVRTAQVRAARAVNVEVIGLYHSIGADILDRQRSAGWGGKVIDRLAHDLREAFPDQRGWSRSNLHYMRALAAAWPPPQVVPQAVGRLPWGHVRVLLDKLEGTGERGWYAAHAVEHGWSRAVLEHQIAGRLHQRIGAAPSNFTDHLPPADSNLAQELVRDPYVFDHLALSERVSERDLEQALMDRLQATLLEFGHGMAFVGRQVRFDVDGDELVIDLLLFHVEQLRYLVVELKVGRFEPAHLGQLGTYVAVVEDRLRRPASHAPTLGLLLVAGRNEHLVRYALSASTAPMAVADYTYEALPAEARAALPSLEELAAALDPSSLPGTAPTAAPGQDPE